MSSLSMELRSDIDKQNNLERELGLRVAQLEVQASSTKDLMRSDKEMDNAVINELQNKVMTLEYRVKYNAN